MSAPMEDVERLFKIADELRDVADSLEKSGAAVAESRRFSETKTMVSGAPCGADIVEQYRATSHPCYVPDAEERDEPPGKPT